MTTIGRVIYEADIDGRRLPAAARKIGKSAGADMGREMGKALDSDFDAALTSYARKWAGRMRANGNISGQSFTQAMNSVIRRQLEGLTSDMAEVFGKKGGIEEFASRFDNAGEAVQRLRDNVERLNSQNLLTDAQYKTLNAQVSKYAAGITELREAEAERGLQQSRNLLVERELEKSLDRIAVKNDLFRTGLLRNNEAMIQQTDLLRESSAEMDKNDKSSRNLITSLGNQGSAWKNLSANTRQWILIIGAISAAGTEIGTLGSAAGAGLTILAGAAGAAAVGVGTAIAAFQDLTGEISELPAEIQPAATAFQSIGDAFSLMQDRIQAATITGLGPAFDSLRQTVEALIPAFELVGGAVATVISGWAAGLAPGTLAFENLYTLIAAAAPIVVTLGEALGAFGTAFSGVFVASIPFVQQFADWLFRIGEAFSEWANSDAGRAQLAAWFEAGVTVLAAFGDLLGTVGTMLADLVTPETVAQTVTFLETLGEFVPIFGGILAVLGDLNIFGLLAQLLLSIGQIIEPILPQLSEMATILSEGLMAAFAALVPPLQELMIALGPLLPVIAQLAVDLVMQLIPAVVALTPLFGPLAELIMSVLNVIIPLIPTITTLVTTIISGLVPVLVPLIQIFIETFAAIEPLMPLIVTLINVALVPVAIAFEVIFPILGKLIGAFLEIWGPIDALIAPIRDQIGAWDGLDVSMGDFAGAIGGWADDVIGAIDDVIGWINDAVQGFLELFGLSSSAPSPGGGGGGRSGNGGGFASGGIAAYAARRLTGEAGTEAIVPLQRPLAQVDPSVRMLAAFAQGKLGNFGGGAGGKTVIFEAGAVQVNSMVPDGTIVAESLFDHIVADADI